jgi:MFS transporter, DHA2 family, multidrug resistance protein
MESVKAASGSTAASGVTAVPGVGAPRVINPWLIAITVTLATFMELLDTSIANVSLPHIAGNLGTSNDEVTWVLTSYLVSNAVVLPLSAWLSVVFGRKNYYMACVALFTLASLMCGLAPNIETLIICRVIQGIGGGGLAPVEQAILVDTFPLSKRAAAFGLYSMAIVTAPAIGPPLGGWITDSFSWRWVFLINIPIGIISLILTNKLVKDPPAFEQERANRISNGKNNVDYLGIILVAIGFGCLEVVLDRGQRLDWLQSDFINWFLSISLFALVSAIFWELRHKNPVVEIQLLKERNFALASCFYFVFGFVLFGSTLLLPQLLETLYGYSATDAGLVLGPGAFVIVMLAPFVVKTVPKVGAKRYLLLGFTILAFSMWHYSHFDLTVDYGSFALARAFQGLGLAFLFVPMSQVAYSYLPKDKNNKASSLTNLFRNQGGSCGIAFVTTLIERRQQFHRFNLVEHLDPGSPEVSERLAAYGHQFTQFGYSVSDATANSLAAIEQAVNRQAMLLGFLDCFVVLGCIAVCAAVLALFVKPPRVVLPSTEPAH